MNAHSSEANSQNSLIAVHIGFAGSRHLFPTASGCVAPSNLEEQLLSALTDQMRFLQGELLKTGPVLLIGVSQVAIGADTLFAQACAQLSIAHRVLLPQPSDSYLAAVSTSPISSGQPDFNEEQREQARALLNSPAVIEERVVSVSANRRERFQETNIEVARLADIIVNLQPERADDGKAGGTLELAQLARHQGKPVLSLTFSVIGDTVKMDMVDLGLLSFTRPRIPDLLGHLKTTPEGFLQSVKDRCGEVTRNKKDLFESRTQWILFGHAAATGIATAVIAWGKAIDMAFVLTFLCVELVLLVVGFWKHHLMQHEHTTEQWAEARLISEIARSTLVFAPEKTFKGQHFNLRHLFDLPFPPSFLPLLRTIEAIQLTQTRGNKDATLEELKHHYIAERFDTTEKRRGQIPYYDTEFAIASKQVLRGSQLFIGFTGLAIGATVIKLLMKLCEFKIAWFDPWLGFIAILSPVLAVTALSWVSSLDKNSRVTDYKEMLEFLKRQRALLNNATSKAEFFRLQVETENRLLGENLSWYHRRKVTTPN